MDLLDLKIAGTIAAAVWLACCGLLYRRFRHAAWLAGSSVAACLALMGLAIVVGTWVSGALYLTPLCLAIGALCAAHLRAASSGVAIASHEPPGPSSVAVPATEFPI